MDEPADIDVYTDNDQCPPSTLRIKTNLEAAIKRLRYKNQDRCLWIDAICINQADKYERNLQVAMMADVYENADRVWVWLGDDEHDGELAFDFINKEIKNLDIFDHIEQGRSEEDKEKVGGFDCIADQKWVRTAMGRPRNRAWKECGSSLWPEKCDMSQFHDRGRVVRKSI